MKTYVGDDGLIHFTDSAGADTALNFSKGLSSINIPSLAISGSLSAFTSNSTQENCGSSTSSSNSLKLYINGLSTLSVGTVSKNITAQLIKSDGTVTSNTLSSNSSLSVTGYEYVTFSISLASQIASGYRTKTTINYSFSIKNLVIS